MSRQLKRQNQPKLPRAVIVVISLLVAVAAFWLESRQQPQQPMQSTRGTQALGTTTVPQGAEHAPIADVSDTQTDHIIQQAFQQQRSDVAVQGQAVVKKVLPDDNDGSRHQRFIIQLSHGQTVLVAHNIDLAPRVENLQAGQQIGFKGDYEYNPRGGVIHWTHHDPQGRHADGWLQYQGKIYQ